MEEIKKDQAIEKSLKGRHAPMSDLVLKIIAVVIAIIIWFGLSITQYPTINKTIKDVPVDFSMSETTAESKGLSAFNYQDITVDVEIQGMNYEIGTYTSSDLIASVDLDPVTKEGTYDLEIEVRSSHSADQCKVVSVSPETVSVKFEHISTKSVTLSTSAPRVSAEDGFTLKETTTDPAEVEVEGSDSDLEQLEKVVAVYSDSLRISEDTTVTADKFIFYDADDNELDSENYTVSTSSVNMTFVVYRKLTVNLLPDFTDLPPDFDISSLPYELSAESLQVISPLLDAAETEDLKLPSVSMYDISGNTTVSFDIASLLSGGEINQSGMEQVELSFDFDGYKQKSFQISSSRVILKNVASGKQASLDTDTITNVTMFGPADVIDNLEEKDLIAVIDLSDVSVNGSATYTVTVYAPDYNTIWNVGTHEAVVTVSDKNVSSSASDSSSTSSSTTSASSD